MKVYLICQALVSKCVININIIWSLYWEKFSLHKYIIFFVDRCIWERKLWPWINMIILSYICGSDDKESACNAGDPGLISGSGRSPGVGHGNPLQYSCLENPVDRGATLWAAVHRVAQSRTWLKWLNMHACIQQRRIVRDIKLFFCWMNSWKNHM